MVKNEVLLLGGLLGVPTAAILYKSIASPSLFSIHPAANAIAFLLLTPSSLWFMSERKLSQDHKTRVFYVKLHLALQILAFFLMVAGGYAVYTNKDINKKDHFVSNHSWIAGVTIFLLLGNVVGGLASTFGDKTKKGANYQWKNPGHRIGGMLSFTGTITTVISGLYSGGWGRFHLGDLNRTILVGCIILGNLFVLGKMLLTAPTKSSSLSSASSSSLSKKSA